MAGPVTPSCHAIRVELTELLLLDRPLPAPLARHLACCTGCSAELAGVRRVIRTFGRAGPPLDGSGSGPGPDSGLPPAGQPRGAWFALDGGVDRSDEVPDADHPKPSRAPKGGVKRRRAAAVAAGVVLAACAVLTTVVPGDHHGAPAVAEVTLSRKEPMIAHSWGTEVPVSLSGLQPGETYHLMTGDAQGRRQSAGSVRAGDGDTPMRTRMVTAMPRPDITTLLVQDESGRMVARLPVAPPAAQSSPTGTPPTADAAPGFRGPGRG
ncbi:hypothetical protein LHJ74_10265 [Streptomyces sp. N2-109]|uniref:Zinc-finger domain-containing protein n=1 Tax=Streptomyces gossypii TaxID=2883101 RepID=A0ABT2JSF3_9ACTN|nr:hypothetical protein [Streptomyces gossypii]MCT2590290.1 hypothetical protein [Streptomyces gossypii]